MPPKLPPMKQHSPTEAKPHSSWNSLATRLRWPLGLFVIVFILVAATIWPVLQDPDQVLAFNDGNIEVALSPVFHFPEVWIRVWDNQTFFGSGLGACSPSFTSLGESLGAEFWRRWAVPWGFAICALGIYWAFRQFRIGRLAAAIAATIVVCSGWPLNSAVTGLFVRLMALTCSAVAMGFVERGRITGQWLPYLFGGGFLGLAVSEIPDIGLLFAFSTATVFLWTHLSNAKNSGSAVSSRWFMIPKFSLFVATSVLIAWQTINIMFATQIKGVTQGSSESPEQRYNWATQWSIPPAELWNTVSGNYFGSSINSPSKPYWGRNGRDANWETTHQGFRNFVLGGWHIGVIPCTLVFALIALAVRTRRKDADSDPLPPSPWLWLIVAGVLVSMMLSWGRFFFLYKLFWSLPFIGTIRGADKWHGPFLLFVGLGSAIVLDAIRNNLATKNLKATSLWRVLTLSFTGMAVIGLIVAFGTAANQDSFINARIADGYQEQASLMWNNAISASVKVFILAGICALGCAWVGRRRDKGSATSPTLVLSVLGLIALGDLAFDNAPYVQGHKYKHYLQPNPLTDYLDAHRTEGRVKILPPNHPLLNNLRLTQLQIKGYDMFDPISMSRMPADYDALFKALEKNPIRLWELGSVRYFLTLPGVVDELNKLDGNHRRFIERLALGVGVVDGGYIPMITQASNQRYLRLVEFTGALPKYRLVNEVISGSTTNIADIDALSTLASKSFDPSKAVTLDTTNIPPLGQSQQSSVTILKESPVEIQLSVSAASPSILVRSSKFDPNWVVRMEDIRLPLLRANYLFQGVSVPAGTHQVTFSYQPSLKPSAAAAVSRLLLIGIFIIAVVFEARRKRSGTHPKSS